MGVTPRYAIVRKNEGGGWAYLCGADGLILAMTERRARTAVESGLPPEQVQKLARNTLESKQMRTLFYGLREGWPMPLLEWVADSVIDGGETTGHGMHFQCVVDTIDLLFDEGWIRTEEEHSGDNLED